ncbi:MAG: phenylacetate--CoA ligase family protein [Chitinispirillaceae bacterium]|nr:phenylacetate--CoA ligase family protein [Chitinispirillaceae bacterium]
MGLDFRIRDFAYPLSMIKAKYQFDKNQYLPQEASERYQTGNLKRILLHAYENVPYYKNLLDKNSITLSSIQSISDISVIPFLTKELLTKNFNNLTALNAQRYNPMVLHTSGTTGGQVSFLVDKQANVLEFVYYWRFWGWHGYHIGNKFAEFSAEHFLPIEKNRETYSVFNPLMNRLLLNSLLLSKTTIQIYISLFRKQKPLFLKGLPSNLYILALLCDSVKKHGISFKAIFSQGENLLPNQKKFIESVFNSPVFDSYGQMERTVAISQCEYGNYHIHSDYSLLELVKPQSSLISPVLREGLEMCEVAGTTLHNMSMPLIRYKTGDLVIIDSRQTSCLCKRTFPLVHSIIGRDSDVIITPDKRAITALYVAFDRLPGIECGQIIQESIDSLRVRIAGEWDDFDKVKRSVIDTIQTFTGREMTVRVEGCQINDLLQKGKKFKSIVSAIDPSEITY